MQPTIRALLVEDAPKDARLLTEMLAEAEEGGFTITHVSRLADAMEAIAREEFDIFLVDLVLPDSTSERTLERIRSIDVPVIVVTGQPRQDLALDMYQSGVHDYFLKGKIDGRVLALAIRYTVERFRFLSSEERQQDVIQHLARRNLRLQEVAEQDPLTGLLNRRGIDKVLAIEVSRSVRTGGELAAVVFDCDDFKSINDAYGHAAGDWVLQTMVARLRPASRPTDHLARIGGDEFLALLPDTRLREAQHVAQRIRRALCEEPFDVDGKQVQVSASFALTPVEPEHGTVEDILIATRVALRLGKSAGKNRVESTLPLRDVHGPVDHPHASAGNLRVVRQPIYDLNERRLVGFEMLSRGPRGKLESPTFFYFLSMEPDALNALDLGCFERCVDAARSLPPGKRAHINVFPSTLANSADRLLEIIRDKGDARPLCIEINERQFLGDPSSLRDRVFQLKEAGVQIAIDDVGFGRSVLEALILLEPDVVKIDRRMVTGIAGEVARQRSLGRLMRVATTLNCETIAEGIETRQDLRAITEVGIRYGQGFLWGQPSERASGEWTAS